MMRLISKICTGITFDERIEIVIAANFFKNEEKIMKEAWVLTLILKLLAAIMGISKIFWI